MQPSRCGVVRFHRLSGARDTVRFRPHTIVYRSSMGAAFPAFSLYHLALRKKNSGGYVRSGPWTLAASRKNVQLSLLQRQRSCPYLKMRTLISKMRTHRPLRPRTIPPFGRPHFSHCPAQSTMTMPGGYCALRDSVPHKIPRRAAPPRAGYRVGWEIMPIVHAGWDSVEILMLCGTPVSSCASFHRRTAVPSMPSRRTRRR